jgi:excisionase family DNA binding protein
MATKLNDLNLGLERDKTAGIFENLVDRAVLAEKLSLSPSYISKLMKSEGLPYFKIGRAVRFKLSEVMKFLSERKRP